MPTNPRYVCTYFNGFLMVVTNMVMKFQNFEMFKNLLNCWPVVCIWFTEIYSMHCDKTWTYYHPKINGNSHRWMGTKPWNSAKTGQVWHNFLHQSIRNSKNSNSDWMILAIDYKMNSFPGNDFTEPTSLLSLATGFTTQHCTHRHFNIKPQLNSIQIYFRSQSIQY